VFGPVDFFDAHGAHRTVDEAHPLAQEHGGRDPADGPDADEAVFIDVGGDDADLVHVGDEHDAAPVPGRFPLRFPFGWGTGRIAGFRAFGPHQQVSQGIDAHGLRVRRYPLLQAVADSLFAARWALD